MLSRIDSRHNVCFRSRVETPDCKAIFEQLALFEISLRIHSKNDKLTNAKDTLHFVIESLKNHRKLSLSDTESLNQGRKFLNMVKHNNGQFDSWSEGISALR